MNKPYTSLFMIQSFDGKISTGDVDELDVDKDLSRIAGVKEGLHQYYDLEKQTDYFSLNSGRVMAKIGVNTRIPPASKTDVKFIIIDNKPHLTTQGVEYIAQWVTTLYLVTTNKNHPAYEVKKRFSNIEIVEFDTEIDLALLLEVMHDKYGAKRVTLQSGGTLNAEWLRRGLIDRISVVIAPCLIGGKDTQSLIGGESLHNQADLLNIKALKLIRCDVLEDSYLHVQYEVVQQTKIENT